MHWVPAYVALQKGWFVEEGISEVEIGFTGDDDHTIEAMRYGKVDIGLDIKPTKVIAAAAQGVPIVIIAGWRNMDPYIFFGRKDLNSGRDIRKMPMREKDGVQVVHREKMLAAYDLTDKDIVRVECGPSVATFRQALLDQGKVDAATVRFGDSEARYQVGLDPKPFLVCGAKAQGADLHIVAGWLNSPAYAFMAARGRKIATLKDLRGKKIALRVPDGIAGRFIRELFRREGMDADQTVTWVIKGLPSRRFQQPLFDSGEVDAGMVILGDAPGMIEEGYPLLADLSKAYPNGYAVRVTAARGDVVRDEPERLTGVLRALIRAYRFMNQRYGETLEILVRAGYELEEGMDRSLWEKKYHMFERIPLDGMVGEQGLNQVIEEEKRGKLPGLFGTQEILLDQFVRNAADSV
ncbi:MAG: ABC transporter substrate-binding protein [Deltaproteobacteria bacterium]|nr:ABC transporter substrate-binding protein [Deltaproteobacteria bacterium]